MEAYSVQMTDANGRPVIQKPINIEDLLRRAGRSMNVGDGMRVYLEEVQTTPGGMYANDDAHRAAVRHGFDDGIHAPFGFGEVQQWYDVVDAVQQGGRVGGGGNVEDERPISPERLLRSHSAHSPHRPPQPQQHDVLPLQPQDVVHPPQSKKDMWSSFAPSVPSNRDFKKVKILDLTPDPKARKFAPLPLAMHSCVVINNTGAKNSSSGVHFFVFGGTNGKSDEAELYEFSLVCAAWRRVETKHHRPVGGHSHASVVLPDEGRMLTIGGVSCEGTTPPAEHLFKDHAPSMKRLELMCPRSTTRRVQRSSMFVDAQSATNLSGSRSASQHRHHTSFDALVPQLAAANGLAVAPAKHRASQVRAFQSIIFDAEVATMRWRAVHSPVTLNVAGHTATSFGSLVYVFGGVSELMEVSDKLIGINPANFSMRILKSSNAAPCARFYHSACLYGNWIIIYGGFDAKNEPLHDAWAFDCVQETWEQLDLMGQPQARGGHCACVVGCRMVIVGGFDQSIDSEGAAPVQSVFEINLVPTNKGQFMTRTIVVPADFPAVAFSSVAHCGDFVSFFVFGGITPIPKKKKSTSDARGIKKGHQSDDEDGGYSSDEDHDEHNASTKSMPSSEQHDKSIFTKFRVSNKAYLVTFPEVVKHRSHSKEQKPKLNHLGLPIEEGEMSPAFASFVKKQRDFLTKRDFEQKKAIRRLHLEEAEAAEVNLYLKPDEIDGLLAKCQHVCDTVAAYDLKSLPTHVPDRELRGHHVEECIGYMRQARDVMKSMKGQEGPKQVKSKGHRKKTGEKFEDFSAAKPFRRVIVMDLISQTHRHMVALRKMNKSLKTVEWAEKASYTHFVAEIQRELQELVDKVKEVLERYINHRVESLVKAEQDHKDKLAKLKEVVEKIQHDKIFQKGRDERRQHRKDVLARDERRNREADDAAHGKKKRRRRKLTHSPPARESAAAAKAFKEVLIEIPKDEAKQLMKRCEWVQKAATEFGWHCANTMSSMQPVVPTVGADGLASQRTATMETVIRDSDAARSAAIDLSNKLASISYAFRSQLEADCNAVVPATASAAAPAIPSSETAAAAAIAGATIVTPTPAAAAAAAAVDKPRDPHKNILLRLSSTRQLHDSHQTLKDLLHTIYRIRLNQWDPNDTGGPKQDVAAEKLCRALFHRQTNLLSRINSAFLMHKGARSPRAKAVLEDPLMMTSAAMQAKHKAARSPSPAVAAVARPQTASSTMNPPAINYARTVGEVPLASASSTMPAYFFRPLQPLQQSFAVEVPTQGPIIGSVDGASKQPWFVEPSTYSSSRPAPSSTSSGASVMPAGAFSPLQPLPGEQPVRIQASLDTKQSVITTGANAIQPIMLTNMFAPLSTSAIIPRQDVQATSFPTQIQPLASTQATAAQAPLTMPLPPNVPAATSALAFPQTASALPLSPQTAVPVQHPAALAPTSYYAAMSAPPAPPVVAPAPQPPPQWMATTSTTSANVEAPPASYTTSQLRPPVPVSVASGPFNAGMGPLGTYAPIEDYIAVMRPTPQAVGFSTTPFAPLSSQQNKTAVPKPATAPAAAPPSKKLDPNFRGKLTPGERIILQSREHNRH